MKRVDIVATGPGAHDLLTIEAARTIEQADIIVGAQRLIDALPNTCTAATFVATRAAHIERILHEEADASWQRACLLMSGDVGLFSGAKSARSRLQDFDVHLVPGVSSVQLFAARLGRPWQSWYCASAHGIACDVCRIVAAHDETFLVTGGDNPVESLCAALVEGGFGDARVSVGERLSYPDERVRTATARDFAQETCDPLSVMLIERPSSHPAAAADTDMHEVWPYASHGIPDDLFNRGTAPMTKQEVRTVALAKLGIAPSDTVYDIGAGTGSVTIEAARLAANGTVYAIERNAGACALMDENARRFGVGNVRIIEGMAPDALQGLPAPHAAFIGGSSGNLKDILALLVGANPTVRVCVTCITLETLNDAVRTLSQAPFTAFEACQVSASRAHAAGSYHLMKAENPVFIVTARGMGERP